MLAHLVLGEGSLPGVQTADSLLPPPMALIKSSGAFCFLYEDSDPIMWAPPSLGELEPIVYCFILCVTLTDISQ